VYFIAIIIITICYLILRSVKLNNLKTVILVMNKVLVLGGGVGGLVVANEIKDKLKDNIEVTLIDKKKRFEFAPSFIWVSFNERKPEEISKDLSLLKKKGINVINDTILMIDLNNKTVKTINDKFDYDYLVIALGLDYSYDIVKDFTYAYHNYNLNDAIKLGEAIKNFNGGNLLVGIARLPFKCPVAPYETALLLDSYCKMKGIRDKTRIRFFTPEPYPIPAAGPEFGNMLADMLIQRGIEFNPKMVLKEIRGNEIVFDGITMQYDLLYCVPPHIVPKVIQDANLIDNTGFIPVNPKTMESKYENVYAIGDVTAIKLPEGSYAPYLPKAGVFAHHQAEVVANNIAYKIKNRGKLKEYDGSGACFIEVAHGEAAFIKAKFFTPKPEIEFHNPTRIWHMQKVLFEKYWLRHWF